MNPGSDEGNVGNIGSGAFIVPQHKGVHGFEHWLQCCGILVRIFGCLDIRQRVYECLIPIDSAVCDRRMEVFDGNPDFRGLDEPILF